MSTSLASRRPSRTASVTVAVALTITAVLAGPRVLAQVDGDTYTNPTYAYQVQWDADVWDVVNEASGDLTLESDVAEVYFQSGQFYDGDATACRDDLVERLPDEESVVSVVPFEGDGDLDGESEGRAYSTLEVVLEEDGDERTVVERIDCRTIVAGEAVLAITWLAPVDDLDVANEPIGDLLDSLVIPSFQDPDTGADGVDGDRYTDPDYGFSLAWDGGDWAPFVPVDALFGLNSGSSLISFDLPREFDGDPAQCVETSLDRLGSSAAIVEISPIEIDGEPVAGLDDAGWSYAAVDVDYGGTRQFVEIRCAAIPGEDVTLRAVHSGAIETYETEAGLGSDVFASLTVIDAEPTEPGSDATPVADATPVVDEPDGTPVPVAGTPVSDPPAATPSPDAPAATPVPDPPSGTPVSEGPGGTPGATPVADVPDGDFSTFEPDDGDWLLVYDGGVWTPLDPAIYATVDLALGGESTVVTFDTVPSNGSSPQEIVDAIVSTEILAVTGDEDDVERLDAPPIGAFADAAGEAYGFVTASGADVAMAVIAIPLSGETAVVIRGYAGPDGFGPAQDAFEDLLDGFEG